MTMTPSAINGLRAPRLDHATAMRLAATEYRRFGDLLRSLEPRDWRKPTNCPPWDVRDMATHLLGMAEVAASLREQRRQMGIARRRGGVFIDAMTGLQVIEHASMTPAEIVTKYDQTGPKAARARRRTPGFIRRRGMRPDQSVNGHMESWTIGYLVDAIFTRDPWMHRIDISLATGAPNPMTAEHDGVIVDDLVHEWADRHGQAFSLRLDGPAGGAWTVGSDGPRYELSVADFALIISGRTTGEGMLATEVPF